MRACARAPPQELRSRQSLRCTAAPVPLSITAAARRRVGRPPSVIDRGSSSLFRVPRGQQRLIVVARSGFFFSSDGGRGRTAIDDELAVDAHADASRRPPTAQGAGAANRGNEDDADDAATAAVVGAANAPEEEPQHHQEEARALSLEAHHESNEQQERQQEDEVLAVVLRASLAAGRLPGASERLLAQRLRDNWYSSARDVASLSAQELEAMGAPLRLRAAAVVFVAEAEARAAADALSVASGGEGGEGEGDGPSSQQQSIEEQEQQLLLLDPDIMKRRAPLRRRLFKRGSVRVTRKAPGASWIVDASGGAAQDEESGSAGEGGDAAPSSPAPPSSSSRHSYGLLEREMHPSLSSELARFERFCTERTLGRRRAPVAPATHQGTVRYLRLFLGWLARVKKAVPSPGAIESLREAFPSREREGAALLFEFRDFLERERGANARTVFNAMMSAAHAVRFLWGEGAEGTAFGDGGSAAGGGGGFKSVTAEKDAAADPPVLREVRAMAGSAFKQTRRCPLVSDESAKWLTWDEYMALVSSLRQECAGLTINGNERSPREVAACLQRYLIFAILSCIPDRQRTLRELRVGHTLVKETLKVVGVTTAATATVAGEGAAAERKEDEGPNYRWTIRHGAADYKTGRLYGARPPLVVAPFIYPELEAYVQTWRKFLEPQHDFLFTTVSAKGGGRALTASSLYKLFSHTALVFTGRPMNPHLMRDLVVTHLRSRGVPENEMEAVAIYMGHSIAQQRSTYDRRTRAQKALPAVELLAGLSSSAAASSSSASAGLGGGGGGGGGGQNGVGSSASAAAVRGMFSNDGLNL